MAVLRCKHLAPACSGFLCNHHCMHSSSRRFLTTHASRLTVAKPASVAAGMTDRHPPVRSSNAVSVFIVLRTDEKDNHPARHWLSSSRSYHLQTLSCLPFPSSVNPRENLSLEILIASTNLQGSFYAF